jgi:AbrB family looped-hinge helix DNA binding protein
MKTCKATKISAVVNVDSKGQILLPKDLREKASINTGDKLVLITGCDENGEICCFILVKSETIDESIRNSIKPILKGIING